MRRRGEIEKELDRYRREIESMINFIILQPAIPKLLITVSDEDEVTLKLIPFFYETGVRNTCNRKFSPSRGKSGERV